MLVFCVSNSVLYVYIDIWGRGEFCLNNLINSFILVYVDSILKNKSFCFFGFIGLLKNYDLGLVRDF